MNTSGLIGPYTFRMGIIKSWYYSLRAKVELNNAMCRVCRSRPKLLDDFCSHECEESAIEYQAHG